jgi:uncharacterized membrane protein YuzA (DUF378 family)
MYNERFFDDTTFEKFEEMNIMLDKISLVLVIIGAINWGAIGLFQFDIVAWICGGQAAIVSRIIYTLVALAGIWCISLLFRDRKEVAIDARGSAD